MKKKPIVISITVFLFCILLIFAAYGWFLSRQEQVTKGLAKPKFPYRNYSISEMKKMFPQYLNEGVETTQTPEETHKKFMTMLKKSDFDEAIKCCVLPGKQIEIRKIVDGAKKKGMFNLMINDLNKINRESMSDTLATYTYQGTSGNKKSTGFMMFTKDQRGTWLINRL